MHNGTIDTDSTSNPAGEGRTAVASATDVRNFSVYIENSFYFVPGVALVAGTQFLHATRDRRRSSRLNGDQSGRREFDLWSPKVGLLWDVDPTWQVFANVSRSAEVPSFGENVAQNSLIPIAEYSVLQHQGADSDDLRDRHAGRGPDYTWDLALIARISTTS